MYLSLSLSLSLYIYIYIYTHTYIHTYGQLPLISPSALAGRLVRPRASLGAQRACARGRGARWPISTSTLEVTIVGWHYLSNPSCLIRPRLFCACFRRVKDRKMLLHYSPLLKTAYVRQVVFDKDKWFPVR